MSIFFQLTQSLIQQLKSIGITLGWQQLTVCMEIDDTNADELGWLKEQKHFPHYFWQHRDTQMTLTAIGAAMQFTCIKQAEQFSQETGMHIIGGVEFEGLPHFVLPRLLFVKNQRKITAYCTLHHEEKTAVLAFLHAINPEKPLRPVYLQPLSTQSASPFERWKENIHNAITKITQQQFDKVVLANATTITFSQPLCPYYLLATSHLKNQACFHFLWAEDPNRSFIGSSPERLYQRQGRTFLTEALAGTVAVSEDIIETEQNALWLLNDQKNRYENWLVVDDICEHLANCTHDIQVGEAEIKRLSHVQHLQRKIQTTLIENISDADCLQRIHPTAAVAGLPRQPAITFIQENEGFKRGWYAGTLGYIHPQHAEFCVTLRSALIQHNQMTVYAGAGIVQESEALSEWQEIERKAMAMINLLESPAFCLKEAK